MTGPLKSQIPLVHQCVLIIPDANYEWSSHSGLPAIRSLQCAQEGIIKSQDGGLQCSQCYDLRRSRGNSNPREFGKKFFPVIQKAIKWRSRKELTPSDIADAKWWKRQTLSGFTAKGKQLYDEAMAQLQYSTTVSGLVSCLKVDQSIKVASPGAVMSPRQFMANFKILELIFHC